MKGLLPWTKHKDCRGEPFPLQEIAGADPDSARAFNEQSVILRAGAVIRNMRETAGLSQRELARRLQTSQAHLSELERGTGTQGPTVLMLQKIARACGADLRIEASASVGAAGRAAAGSGGDGPQA